MLPIISDFIGEMWITLILIHISINKTWIACCKKKILPLCSYWSFFMVSQRDALVWMLNHISRQLKLSRDDCLLNSTNLYWSWCFCNIIKDKINLYWSLEGKSFILISYVCTSCPGTSKAHCRPCLPSAEQILTVRVICSCWGLVEMDKIS